VRERDSQDATMVNYNEYRSTLNPISPALKEYCTSQQDTVQICQIE